MESNKIERPMDEIQKIREALKPLGLDIVGFEYPKNDYITLKIAYTTQ